MQATQKLAKVIAGLAAILALAGAAPPSTQELAKSVKDAPGIGDMSARFPEGSAIYAARCAGCHDSGAGRTPSRAILSHYSPQTIRKALTSGAMRSQGAGLSDAQKTQVAEFLVGRKLSGDTTGASAPRCTGKAAQFDFRQPPAWVNWGIDSGGAHYVAPKQARLDAKTARSLKVKWAFGFPGANRARSQPALGAGAVYVGSHDGTVYALDRETGCVRWQYEGSAEVRTGIVLSPWKAGNRKARPMVWFGDFAGHVYGLDAQTGAQVWKLRADSHPAAVITGTPSLHDGTLYVPVSSLEEASAAAPDYECCTFRGSILALDASTGKERWRTWMVDPPLPTGKTASGTTSHGPSGVAVWTAPLIDAPRGQLYVTTGDNYTHPANHLSDAIVALDLKSGAIRWHYQAIAGDAWNVGCFAPDKSNCPEDAGPDFDFGAAPILAKASDGRDYVIAGQKSGIAYAVDPANGKLAWQHRAGRGGMAGGIHFGIAASKGRLFIPVSDMPDGQPADYPHSPGLYAVDIASGKRLWSAPAPDPCKGREACVRGYAASIMATDDLVIAGSDDGFLRLLDAANGALVWEMDTARAFPAVGGGTAQGGAISGSAGAVLDKGQLFVSSGYGFVNKMPGNLLLVLEAK